MLIKKLFKSASLIAAITFNNWLLGIFLNWRLFKAGGSVSEFSASDQPYHLVFRTLDITSGFFFCLLALFIYNLAGRRRFWKWMSLGTLVLGLANCLDALLPLPCSGTVDASCSAPVRLSFQRVSLPDHVFSSLIIGVCYILIPLAVLIYSKRRANEKNKILSLAVLGSTIAFFGFLLMESLFEGSLFDHLAGYSQELQMLLLAWLFVQVSKLLSSEL